MINDIDPVSQSPIYICNFFVSVKTCQIVIEREKCDLEMLQT